MELNGDRRLRIFRNHVYFYPSLYPLRHVREEIIIFPWIVIDSLFFFFFLFSSYIPQETKFFTRVCFSININKKK